MVEKGSTNTFEFLFENKKMANKPVQPDLKIYLAALSQGPEALAFLAARNGDILILEKILHSRIFNLSRSVTQNKEKIRSHQFIIQREALLRREKVLVKIISILEAFYQKHGARKGFYQLDELQAEISFEVDKLIKSFTDEYKKRLIDQQEDYINGQLVKLDAQSRATKLNQFKQSLRNDLATVDTRISDLTLTQITDFYTNTKNKLTQLRLLIQEVDKQHQLCMESLPKALTELDGELKEHEKSFCALLSQLIDAKEYRSDSVTAKILELPEINVDVIDPETGNNLLHEALRFGQFPTALYLIFKGLNYKIQNKAGLPAIDTQDSNGDSLLHYLARTQQYETLCPLILNGAKLDSVNLQQQQMIDISADNKTFYHFLNERMASGNKRGCYFDTLAVIAKKCLTIPHLLTSGNINPPKNVKILEILKEARFADQNFKSPFQADVNFAMWKHFFFLINPENTKQSILDKLFGSNLSPVEDQLKYLLVLYQHLKNAKSNQSTDEALLAFLQKMVQNLSLPPAVKDEYQNYIDIANGNLKKGNKSGYLTRSAHETRNCYLNSSYKRITEQVGHSEEIINETAMTPTPPLAIPRILKTSSGTCAPIKKHTSLDQVVAALVEPLRP